MLNNNTNIDQGSIDVEGVHSLLELPDTFQKKLEWSILQQTVSKIRSSAFAVAREETKGGRTIDVANEEEAQVELKEAHNDSLARMGCAIKVVIEPRDNLRRWLQIYYTLGRAGWKLDPRAISDAFQYIQDQDNNMLIADDAQLEAMSKLSRTSVEAIKKALEKQKNDKCKQTEKNIVNATTAITEITNELADNWQDIADNAMPEGWPELVEKANDQAKKNEIRNPVEKTVEGKLASLINLTRINVVDLPARSTADLHERDTFDMASGMYVSS